MRQIQEEYYKVSESSSAQHVGAATTGAATGIEQVRTDIGGTDKSILIPPSPLKGDLSNIPEEVRKMILQLSGTMLEGVKNVIPEKKENNEEETHSKDGTTGTVSV